MWNFYFDRLTTLWIAMVCSALFIGCTPEAHTPPEDPYRLWREQPNDRLIFMSRADAPEGELYILDEGGQITRLTHNNRHENNPALSYSKDRVAFQAGDENNPLTWEIYTLDLESGEEQQLTDNGVIDAHPDWSPDGSRIVFGSFRDGDGNPAGAADIYLMSSEDGSDLVRLTGSAWEDNDPEWSPDGLKIVFKSTRRTRVSGREEIFVMNWDGSDPRRLTTTTGWESDHDPSWSPDSKEVVFNRFQGSRAWIDTANFAEDWQALTPWNVHRVDLAGKEVKLTDHSQAGWGVVLYSAGGSRILYGRIDWILGEDGQVIGGQHRLILMEHDGSNQRQMIADDRHTGTLEYFDW